MGMEEVGGRGFVSDEGVLMSTFKRVLLERGRKMSSIPGKPLIELLIKEVKLFDEGRANARTLDEIVIERGSATSLGANNQESGQEAQRAGHASIEFRERSPGCINKCCHWLGSLQIPQKRGSTASPFVW